MSVFPQQPDFTFSLLPTDIITCQERLQLHLFKEKKKKKRGKKEKDYGNLYQAKIHFVDCLSLENRAQVRVFLGQ